MPETDADHQQGEFSISTDPSRLNLDVIHGFLSRSYWAEGIPRDLVTRSIEHSLCFGLYHGAEQIGFARVITDYTTFGYLGDVFVIEAYRGRGLSKWLMRSVLDHPRLSGFRRWLLATADAHGLYQQNGFQPLGNPGHFMEIAPPNPYLSPQSAD